MYSEQNTYQIGMMQAGETGLKTVQTKGKINSSQIVRVIIKKELKTLLCWLQKSITCS